MFCVGSGHLIGLIGLKKGIRTDTLKVQAILDLPTPSNLLQIQKLQGKANFLRRFIQNYAEMAKGFTRLLKKGVPFHWDQVAQAYFDFVKDHLFRASVMYPPNYQNDYFLYIIAVEMTTVMVLVLLATYNIGVIILT